MTQNTILKTACWSGPLFLCLVLYFQKCIGWRKIYQERRCRRGSGIVFNDRLRKKRSLRLGTQALLWCQAQQSKPAWGAAEEYFLCKSGLLLHWAKRSRAKFLYRKTSNLSADTWRLPWVLLIYHFLDASCRCSWTQGRSQPVLS